MSEPSQSPSPKPAPAPASTSKKPSIPLPPQRYGPPPVLRPLPIPPPARTQEEKYNRFAPSTHIDAAHTEMYFKIFLKRDPVTRLEYQNFLKDDLKYVYVHRPVSNVKLPGPAELLKITEPVPASAFKKRKVNREEAIGLPSTTEMLGFRPPGSSSAAESNTRANKQLPSPASLLSLTHTVPASVLDAETADAAAKTGDTEDEDMTDHADSNDKVHADRAATNEEANE